LVKGSFSTTITTIASLILWQPAKSRGKNPLCQVEMAFAQNRSSSGLLNFQNRSTKQPQHSKIMLLSTLDNPPKDLGFAKTGSKTLER
jgi:hypothetical protein